MRLGPSISAVITGGASGLGGATARKLAAKGVKVALFDMNEELGKALSHELGCVFCMFCKVNVTSESEVDVGFANMRAANGQERLLINCAGTGASAKTAIVGMTLPIARDLMGDGIRVNSNLTGPITY